MAKQKSQPKVAIPSQPMTRLELWKSIALGSATVLISFLCWWAVSKAMGLSVLSLLEGKNWIGLVLALVVFFFFLAFISLSSLLIDDKKILGVTLALSAFSSLAWFHGQWFFNLVGILIFVGFWQFAWHIRREENARVRFSLSTVIHHGLGTMIAVTTLSVALIYYGVQLEKRTTPDVSPTDSIVTTSTNVINQLLTLQMPGYSQDEPVDTFLIRVLANAGNEKDFNPLKGLNPISPEALLEQLPEDVRDQLPADPNAAIDEYLKTQAGIEVQTQIADIRNDLFSQFGIVGSGKTPMRDVVRQLVAKPVTEALPPYEKFIPPVLALSLFFALQIFAFLYILVITLIAELLFVIFKATGFLRFQEQSVTIATPTLK